MSCFKRSTSRDFRIDGTTVSAILHGQEVHVFWYDLHVVIYSIQDNDNDEDNSSSTGSPKAKKLKLSFASNSTTD